MAKREEITEINREREEGKEIRVEGKKQCEGNKDRVRKKRR